MATKRAKENDMRVEQIMSQPAVTCGQDDALDTAARLMWDNDCGVVPVVGDDGAVVGILTDRDICMAAYTQGMPLRAIPVSRAMAKQVFWCHPEESLEAAEALMTERRVRRLPVVGRAGLPIGVISLNDIAREAAQSPNGNGAQREVANTLAAICQPRAHALQPVHLPQMQGSLPLWPV
jgi:CBS domain-containing protein